MARNRDIKIWKDPFYRALPPLYKCLWDYINDDCDNAGVWHVDFKIASICVGRKVKEELALQHFGDRIQISPDGNRWYINTFLREKLNFDPANLKASDRFQKSIIDLFEKHEIEKFKGVVSPLQGAIYKYKENAMASASTKEGVQGEIQELKTQNSKLKIVGPARADGLYLTVKSPYVHEPHLQVHDLPAYFTQKDQLLQLQQAGWIRFDEFMKHNPAAIFNDAQHLYNTFRNFHIKPPKESKAQERKNGWDAAARMAQEKLDVSPQPAKEHA